MIYIVPTSDNCSFSKELSFHLTVEVLPVYDPLDIVFGEGDVLINLMGDDNPYTEELPTIIDIHDVVEVAHLKRMEQCMGSYVVILKQMIAELRS